MCEEVGGGGAHGKINGLSETSRGTCRRAGEWAGC